MVETASIDLEVLVGDVRSACPIVSGAADNLEEAVLDVTDVIRGTLGEGDEGTFTDLLTGY